MMIMHKAVNTAMKTLQGENIEFSHQLPYFTLTPEALMLAHMNGRNFLQLARLFISAVSRRPDVMRYVQGTADADPD